MTMDLAGRLRSTVLLCFGGTTLSAAAPTVAEKSGSGSGVQNLANKRKGAPWAGGGIGQSL